MDLEREAIRLSAMIALCISAFIIMWSIDEFHQQQVPARVGETQCSWWSATVQGCKPATRSLSEVTKPSSGLAFNL
ncbi:MAG: hypothetical protein AAGA06_03095 [Pseudomonadota bacterium]